MQCGLKAPSNLGRPAARRRQGTLGAMNSDDLPKLLTTEMPFGKYQGTLIADLPSNYLAWFAREGFPQGQIGRLLALMHELDVNGLRELLRRLR